ncbi:CPCC family cysteine-rich protein [Streptomyces aidingensis]
MPSRALTRISRLRTPAPDGRLRCPADWPGVLRQHIPWHTDGTCNETAQVSNSYPCPCCGHRVLDAMPGSYEICPVCFWEDDHVQFRWPTMPGGANKVSLVEAQRNYQEFGASDQLGRRYVRPPAEDEPLDPAWRPIDLTRLRGLGGRGPRPLARRPLGALLVAPHFLSPGPLRVMTSHIETLVRQLDGKADESYDARAELIRTGADAIPAVIDGLPSLGGFGQLTAVEVFEEVADPRCGPALIGLLDSDNPTVRERGFTEIINDLADHAQVILCSQFWRVDAGRTDGVHGPGLDREVDWTAPWEHLVEESRTWSLLEASEGEGRLVPEGLRGGPQGVGVLEFGADAGAVGAVEGCCRPAKPGALRADRERAAPPPPQVRGRSA